MVVQWTELWFNPLPMEKARAIELLGGTVATAAEVIGITYQAVDKWPDVLPQRIADRVLAALARKHLPRELIGDEARPQPAAHPAPVVSFASLPEAVQRRAITGES